jgi:DNA-binding NarL/FixJ family response regulator
MTKPRVILADDHRILAEGLRGLLEPELDVVAVVADGRELVDAARRHRPDVIIADVSMPALNGIEATAQLRGLGIEARVVILSMHRDVAYVRRALEAGAAGYVLKHSAMTELLTAVREALQGRTFVTPALAGELLQVYSGRGQRGQNTGPALTPRQREVLQLFVEGRSAKEVAGALKISTRTAEFHRARIMEALGLQTTADLVQYAIRQGIISV